MANVNFYRDTKANIDNVAYTDGQMYFPTDQNKIYLDTGNQRKQYGGDTEVDSALSTTSTNPVQNNIVTTSLNQKVAKTDVVNDLDSAVAVTATDVPVGCGAIKELNTSLTAPTVGMFFYDYQDGKHGYNTDPSRGADTFHPFKSGGNVVFLYSKRSTFWGDAFTAVHVNNNPNKQLTLTSKVSGSYKMKLYLKTSSSAASIAYTVNVRNEVVLTASVSNIPYEADLEFDLSVGDTIVFSEVGGDVYMYGIVISEA